jgi:hypothetical protein
MLGSLGALLVAMVVGERPTTDYLLTIALAAFAVSTIPPKGLRRFWMLAMLPALILLGISFHLDEPWSAILGGVGILWYVGWFVRGVLIRRRRGR